MEPCKLSTEKGFVLTQRCPEQCFLSYSKKKKLRQPRIVFDVKLILKNNDKRMLNAARDSADSSRVLSRQR